MLICIDVRYLSYNPTGIGYYIYNFIKELHKLDDIDLVLITDVIESEELIELQEIGIRIIQSGKKLDKRFRTFKYFQFLKKQLLEIKPDIFWEPSQIFPYVSVSPECKVVITMHDIIPLKQKEYFKLYKRLIFYGYLKSTLRKIDGIIYTSLDTKSIFLNRFKINPCIKEHISYCIVEKEARSLIEDRSYFFYVGSIVKTKGSDLLLSSFKEYIEQGGDKNLVLAGRIHEQDLAEMIDMFKERHPNRLDYRGYIDEKEKDLLYAGCSCFVFPSRAEGFGIPPIEAMYYDKPIIVSDLDVFYETMGKSVNYFILENSNSDIANLTAKLFDYSKDTTLYFNVKDKYKGNKRAKELYNYFKSLIN